MPHGPTAQEAHFAAVDFESAGVVKGGTDTPIQIGIAIMHGLSFPPADQWVSYLGTDRPVTWQASQVHGITTDDLRGAPPFISLWPEVKSRLGNRWVVAHGAGTEKRFLRAFPLHGFGPWVDTLLLARKFWPGIRDYSLETLIAAGGLHPELEAACPGRRFPRCPLRLRRQPPHPAAHHPPRRPRRGAHGNMAHPRLPPKKPAFQPIAPPLPFSSQAPHHPLNRSQLVLFVLFVPFVPLVLAPTLRLPRKPPPPLFLTTPTRR